MGLRKVYSSLSILFIFLLCFFPYASKYVSAVITDAGDEFLVVDCLLPGQIRKLGRKAVYQTPRRAVKTSARDCEIRGGEYIAYDRSNYATALKVWLEDAQKGDPVAQNYVGEIYEKGLGTAPDYASAAQWFKKAAEQGYGPAQINLGHLYEKGLGVQKNPQSALYWYRKASGLTEAISLVPSEELKQLQQEVETRRQESEQLRRQLLQTQQELEQTRRELEKRKSSIEFERRKLEEARQKLAGQKQQTEVKVSDSELKRLEAQLKQRETELVRQRQEIENLEKEANSYRIQLAKLDQQQDVTELKEEIERSKKESEALRNQLAQTQQELDKRKTEAQAQQEELQKARQEVEKLKQQSTAKVDSAELKKLEAQLEQRQKELDLQRQKMEELENKAEKQSKQLAMLEGKKEQADGLGDPSIELIDPRLLPKRGITNRVETRAGIERMIVGKITASAGLLTFTVNDVEEKVDPNGLFRFKKLVQNSEVPVKLVAVDKRGKSATLEFLLSPSGGGKSSPPLPVEPDIGFGKYYALIIGNTNYSFWPKLQTPRNDANEVARILRDKYGFQTKVLLNANRRDILQALDEYRKNLTEKDNLLIYYAGHGHLDESIGRGYWIPVDGELDSSVQWIQTFAITDVLAAMSAKHVLVVADSCYSGMLTRSSIARLEAGMSEEARKHWLKVTSQKRSRTVLSSGDLQPVVDTGGGGHSVFAKAFLDVLRENNDILEGQRLYTQLSSRVAYAADVLAVEQIPQYAPIQYAGHEAGDFLFVPKK